MHVGDQAHRAQRLRVEWIADLYVRAISPRNLVNNCNVSSERVEVRHAPRNLDYFAILDPEQSALLHDVHDGC